MKFVLAPDSFKSSMSAQEVCNAMARGINQAHIKHSEIIKAPMADGGEGTVDALVNNNQGVYQYVPVQDPMGHPIIANYGLIDNERVAVIEMASASGIQYHSDSDFDLFKADTYGTGQLILDALNHHVDSIIIGLGGSTTNDGGYGMARALGACFLNNHGKKIQRGQLNTLASIDIDHLDRRLKRTSIKVASDVTNPLVGSNGASAVFGPQKGANASDVQKLDSNLRNYADVIQKDLGIRIKDVSGSGAAGGLGAGLLTFTNAELKSGVQLVMKMINLSDRLQDANIVITGEGSIDRQTQYGKVPMGVAQLAKKIVPKAKVIALGGHVAPHLDVLHQKGITAIFPIIPGAMNLTEAIKTGPKNITSISNNIVRLLC